MILETIPVGSLEVNCYILASGPGSQAIIIDPGAEAQKIKQALNKHKLKAAFIINTHGHFDHIGCDDKFDVPVYIHQKDAELLNDPKQNLSAFFIAAYAVKSKIIPLEEKQVIELEKIRLEVIHTPGHTPGGICLLLDKPESGILFSGDTLFCQGVGRTDYAGASETVLLKSIREKLFILPDDTIIYPGHGPASTIGREKKENPFLSYDA